MSHISIDGVRVDGSNVRYETSCSDDLRRFFAGDDFRVSYGTDVSSVPDRLLTVPVLAQVCPVAWANGATVYTPVIDEEFLESLRTVRRSLLDMYPEFMVGGEIEYGRAETGGEEDRRETALLFTGGVDSMATYLGHREEDPQLITIRGWVFDGDESGEWGELKTYVGDFADEMGVTPNFVEANITEFLNPAMLNASYRRYLDGTWYAAVGHGLGLLGIAAPLAAANGIGTLYMAATYHEGLEGPNPWGSHPSIDDNVRWSGTSCVHDGYDLSRQEKIDRIAAFVTESPHELRLQTCNESVENCSRCAKCLRTIAGLLLAGLEPDRVGYDADEDTLDLLRDRFDDPEFYLMEHRWAWEDIQHRYGPERELPDGYRAEQFFEWLADQDLEDRLPPYRPPFSRRLKLATLRHVPYPVYAFLSSVASGR